MIEEYLQGSVGQLLERARSLQGAISKPFPPEFRALVQTCRNEVNVLIDQFGKLLTDPRFKKANVQETRLRVFQRLVKDLDFIECVGFAALTRINDEDKALTKLISDITEEIRFPLIAPVACCQSHHSDYFGAFTMLGLVHVPLLEARFLLHLPDLYHELCHFILTEENNPVVERYQQALERAISAATGHLAPMLAGSSRGPKAAKDLALAWTACWLDSWGKELFCDLFGVLAVGPAYAWAHLHLCAKSGQDPYAVTSPTHPPDEARLEVLLIALSHLKYQREASLIEKKWRDLHALKKTKNTADYASCFPRSVLRKCAEEAIRAYDEMNCRSSAPRFWFSRSRLIERSLGGFLEISPAICELGEEELPETFEKYIGQRMTIDPRLHRIVAAQPYPLLFATISGAHLYGFPSPDSDFDLRGAHVLPLEKVVGLEVRDETVEDSRVIEGLEMDIVSHDVRKFFGLLLKKNGYVLEQLFSPLVVHTTPEHEELKEICRARISSTSPNPLPGRGGEGGRTGVITKHHSHHYFGFAETQWKLFDKALACSHQPRRVKPLLYVYRVLLTGIHLMRTGEVEANLVTLNNEFRLPYISDLVARKQSGENTTLADADVAFQQREYERLRTELQTAHEASRLPELPSEQTRAALNDLLLRVRLNSKTDRSP